MAAGYFDLDALLWCAKDADPSLALDAAWPTPCWCVGCAAVTGLFGLERPVHFLRHHRGLLPRLWERQITQALKELLLSSASRTLERCQALVDALEGAGGCRMATIDRVTADAADRIDLAIHCRDVEGVERCLVIEAKLGSEISDGQLAKYRRGLLRSYPRPDQRMLWVVAPARTSRTAAVLGRAVNSEWRFATWRRLLLNWQQALTEDAGGDVLSLFAEIWKCVGGR